MTSIGKDFLLFVTTCFTLVIWCHKKYIIYKIFYSSAPDGSLRPKNPITPKLNKYLLSSYTEPLGVKRNELTFALKRALNVSEEKVKIITNIY